MIDFYKTVFLTNPKNANEIKAMAKINKLKTLLLAFAIAVVGYLIWYFLIIPYDYAISFYVKTSPGTVYEEVADWKKWDNFAAEESTVVTSKKPYSELDQHVPLNNTELSLHWTFMGVNDSTTRVRVEIKDLKNSLKNRLTIPFSKTEFEDVMRFKMVNFKKKVDAFAHREFRVKIEGEAESPASFVVYVPLKSSMKQKAFNMMSNDGFLLRYIDSMKLRKNGNPIIEVTDWNVENDSIEYIYAFPISKTDSLPQSDLFKFKKIPSRKSIKATFNGNYRISDKAWYAIYDYALRNNIKIENKVFETFLNNPHNGGDNLDWKAEIYIPIKE